MLYTKIPIGELGNGIIESIHLRFQNATLLNIGKILSRTQTGGTEKLPGSSSQHPIVDENNCVADEYNDVSAVD